MYPSPFSTTVIYHKLQCFATATIYPLQNQDKDVYPEIGISEVQLALGTTVDTSEYFTFSMVYVLFARK